MNFLTYVGTWIAIGLFTAWIARNIEKPGQHGVIANVPVAVFGALLGGLAARAIFGGPPQFNNYLASVIAAQIVAAVFIALGDIGVHQHTNPHRRAP
jgi:uncharacterized membrane protein YeaQ/YmgE (transglycosylase-associated protein family)